MPQQTLNIQFYESNGSMPPYMAPRDLSSETARLVGSQWVRKGEGRRARISTPEGEPLYDIKASDNPDFYVVERYGLSSDVEIPSECQECGHNKHLPTICQEIDCGCGAIEEGEGYVN